VMVYCSRHRQLLGTVLAEGFVSFLETLRDDHESLRSRPLTRI
jgi:hypothetical protein